MIVSDARASLRNLTRARGFALLVVATLALGIGANAAVFSVLDAVVIKPLPYPEPEALVTVQETWRGNPPNFAFTRAPATTEMRKWTDIFSQVATIYTYRETGADLVTSDGATRLITSYVSAGFFETLGTAPVLGRTFREEESYGPGERGDDTERPRVAVVSNRLWRDHFGADQSVVGQNIELDGRLTEVVGVMPRGFQNPMGTDADLWIPQDLRSGGSNSWNNYYLNTIARLKPGITLELAMSMSNTLVEGVREDVPESGEWGVHLTQLQSDVVGTTRQTMLLLLTAAAALVLLSACVNVSNLVFARGINREREIALRGALGSARERTLGLLVLENAWLAVGGSLLGVALGLAGVKLLLANAPETLPSVAAEPSISGTMLLAAIGTMAISLLVFGLAPSVLLSRVPLARALSSGGRSGTETRWLRRLRSMFVVAQVTVAMVLLIGAGLLMRSFNEIRQTPLGVEPEQALTFEVHLPSSRYSTGEERDAFHRQFQERLAALPGVSAVGAVSWLPLNERYHTWGLVEDQGNVQDDAEPDFYPTDFRVMAGDYFAAAGMVLLQGNLPDQTDQGGEPLIWISQLASEHLSHKDPVGSLVYIGPQSWRIAGVVSDVALDARGTMVPTVYVTHQQFSEDRAWPLTQMIRASADVDLLRAAADRELHAIDPSLVLFRARQFEGFIDVARAQDRFILLLMSVFALLAVGLVTVGTYGVLSESVARRTKEIGIRMALGANHGAVRWNIVRGAMALVGGGLFLGCAASLAASRWLSSMLFGVSPTDTGTYISAGLVLLIISVVASLGPALRATRVQPSRALSES